MTSNYQLSDLQYGILQGLNESDKPAIVTEPNPVGSLEERKLVEDYLKQMQDLVDLSFIKETTSEDCNKGGIEACIEKFGFGYHVYHITDTGRLMFIRQNLVVN
jgi:hypothetical protein